MSGLCPPTPARAIIEIRDLHLSFSTAVVLDGVNLDVRRGENLVLIGVSGSGKTVLLLLGLSQPDSGSIRIDGRETTTRGGRARDAQTRRIGVLSSATRCSTR